MNEMDDAHVGCFLFFTDCVDYLSEWMYGPRDVMSEWTIYWNE